MGDGAQKLAALAQHKRGIVKPFSSPGGKEAWRGLILQRIPDHDIYVEPYAGGQSVLLARDPDRDWFIDEAWKLKHGDKVPSELRGCSEVVGDINGELTNFWRVLQNPGSFA